jgi:hypothetical protein
MTAPVVLRVYGTPAPQGSKSAFVRGGRAVLVEGKGPGRQSHATWRQAVATAARDWQEANGGVALLDGDIALTVCFLFAKPASKPKKAEWANVKPYAVRDEAPGCWVVLEPVQRQLITPWMRKAAALGTQEAVS